MVLIAPTRYAASFPTANAAAEEMARYQMNHGLLMPPVAATPTVTKAMSSAIQTGLSFRRSTPRAKRTYIAAKQADEPIQLRSETSKRIEKTCSALPISAVANAAV